MKTVKVLFDSPHYLIMETCLLGYEPRFELYQKRKILFIRWNSFVCWSMSLCRIYDVMNKRMGAY